jgi:20S proteasome alpha/beta subunit
VTIIIGTLCEDGVVVGADSSATLTAGDIRIIEQPNHGKIQIINKELILAGTGQVGMGQRFHGVVESNRDSLRKLKPVDAVTKICGEAVKNFASTNAHQSQYGAILAYYANGNFSLCEFAVKDLQPELKNKECWFVSMGSGQLIADPFLALLRRIFWPDKMPRVNEAVFAVMWVLNHAIEVNAGGINGPPHVAILTKPANAPVARFLEDNEFQEHLANVQGVEEHLRAYSQILQGAHLPANAPPPSPPLPMPGPQSAAHVPVAAPLVPPAQQGTA